MYFSSVQVRSILYLRIEQQTRAAGGHFYNVVQGRRNRHRRSGCVVLGTATHSIIHSTVTVTVTAQAQHRHSTGTDDRGVSYWTPPPIQSYTAQSQHSHSTGTAQAQHKHRRSGSVVLDTATHSIIQQTRLLTYPPFPCDLHTPRTPSCHLRHCHPLECEVGAATRRLLDLNPVVPRDRRLVLRFGLTTCIGHTIGLQAPISIQ